MEHFYFILQTKHCLSCTPLSSLFLHNFQSDPLTGIFNLRLWPSLVYMDGRMLYEYTFYGGRRGLEGRPTAFVRFSKGWVTSKVSQSMALIFFHFSDTSHGLWMLPLFSYNRLSQSWDWVARGLCFQELCKYSTGIFPGEAKKKKTELNSFTSTLTQGECSNSSATEKGNVPHQASHNPLSLDYYWSLTPGPDSTPWVYTVSLSTHSLRLLPAKENNTVLIVEGKNRLPKQVVHLPEFLLAMLILQLQISITISIG